jgi:hypothetical protein
MDNEQKDKMYGQLLNEHTRLQNEISSIKGESIDLNQQQLNKIKELQQRQMKIMTQINRLLS